MHVQGCLILSQVGLLFPVNHAPMKMASLTGFAPVISYMRGGHVDWTTLQGQIKSLASWQIQSVKASSQMTKGGPRSTPQQCGRARLRIHYDRLWAEAIGKIRKGSIDRDALLAQRAPDPRRGLTVIARPSAAVRERVAVFLKQLQLLEPAQYYYVPSALHLTVLSLFTATVEHRPFFARENAYVAAVDSALRKAAPIQIEFEGVTASPGTVMIQGFFENDRLNDLRDALRTQLQARGLAEGLDQRYRLESAHMTVVRFRVPLADGERFAQVLELARAESFGETTLKSVSLVQNDWYLSHRVTKTVKRYRLSHPG